MLRRNIYFSEDTLRKADKLIGIDGMKSRSDVIAKAVNFYEDYLNNKEVGSYLCEEIQSIIKSNLNLVETRLGNRLGKLLSESVVQLGMTQKILIDSLDIKEEDITDYRLEVLEEIKNNQAVIKYEKLKDKERKCHD